MYTPNDKRYDKMIYNRVGDSGLKLPALSLGLWKNFGADDTFSNMEKMIHTAFDLGITHFDLANNYGHPYIGSAESNFGRILDNNGLRRYRDEMVISTKAGFEMWDGPYGAKHGSRKYLTASLDQSLDRMDLDYVDIYYHHVYDPDTPLEETALALDHAVKQGKALYIGISNYKKAETKEIMTYFKELRTPFIVNQPSYSMLNRWVEEDQLDDFVVENGIGLSIYSPLYQGFLTGKYLDTIPADSRVKTDHTWLEEELDKKMITRLNNLNDIAENRGQKLSQMALSWVLHNKSVSTVLVGASRPEQIIENVGAIDNLDFSKEEIEAIENTLKD